MPEPPTTFADLLTRNGGYQNQIAHGGFDGVAHAGVAMVTCMDSRIEPLKMIGLKIGDAKIMRTPGGRVTPDALVGCVLSVHLLGVNRILVVPHTRCAMAGTTEDELREQVERAAGQPAGYLLPLEVIPDQFEALRRDVAAVREHPLIGSEIAVGGFMYDVDTGRLDHLV